MTNVIFAIQDLDIWHINQKLAWDCSHVRSQQECFSGCLRTLRTLKIWQSFKKSWEIWLIWYYLYHMMRGQVISPQQVSFKQGFPIVFMVGDGLWNSLWKGTSFPRRFRGAWGWIPSLAWLLLKVTPFSAKFRWKKQRWSNESWHNLTYKTSNSRYSICFRICYPNDLRCSISEW